MSCFDEQPDGDIHGECAVEIARLEAENAVLREALKEALPALGYGYDAARCTAAFETIRHAETTIRLALAAPDNTAEIAEQP